MAFPTVEPMKRTDTLALKDKCRRCIYRETEVVKKETCLVAHKFQRNYCVFRYRIFHQIDFLKHKIIEAIIKKADFNDKN